MGRAAPATGASDDDLLDAIRNPAGVEDADDELLVVEECVHSQERS